ncbi:MAG: hypothetical protein ACXWQO_05060 [Bdellovibrionota bacterium]
MRSLKNLAKISFAAVALLGIAFTSRYRIEALGKMDFEIATMLTPWGIFEHFCLNPYSYLGPYYFTVTAGRASVFNDPWLALSVLVLLTTSLSLLTCLRRSSP